MDLGILTELEAEAVIALAGWVGGGRPGLASASAGCGLSARLCSIAGRQAPHQAAQEENTSAVLFMVKKQTLNSEFYVPSQVLLEQCSAVHRPLRPSA